MTMFDIFLFKIHIIFSFWNNQRSLKAALKNLNKFLPMEYWV